ncbi:S-adenosylmethionine-dependent methyltransferase [Halomicronema hongdechloris C2206]|uniref:S-adenosylmethionine-dependent methyltransferase n=1 Tax=Halomicronema hongdechloris C2206 TaxID=1641165 RepID=A0A1Z3HM85_9CYAN|nr:S-adenosylmethionine-dependent methyltransferase [Halomicronema hongdechloris C2206]
MTTPDTLIPTDSQAAPPFDPDKAEAFAGSLLATLNAGGLSLMISIGHRTHLFDVLADLHPATSQEVADATYLQERYVREWLNAMTVGRIVNYDPASQTYHLPTEHAAFLTRAAKADNIASIFQHIASLGLVEDAIVRCFLAGGGVPYAEFTRFHAVMAEDSGQTVVAALEDQILPIVPGLVDRLKAGIDVLDVGCGSGRALNKLAQLFPASRLVGYDISEDTIAIATNEAQAAGLTNVRFQVKDAAQIDEVERYDLITSFDAVHDQARPNEVLRKIYTALRPEGGVYLMQDIRASSQVQNNLDHPMAPFLYTISCMHCMTVSLAEGGMGLGTMWGREQAMEMLAEVGFQQVELKELPHDIVNDYYVIRKGVIRKGGA